MAEAFTILDRFHLEWWQMMLVVLSVGSIPLFKALAVVLVAKFVKPEIAKVALPLMFQPRRKLLSKSPQDS